LTGQDPTKTSANENYVVLLKLTRNRSWKPFSLRHSSAAAWFLGSRVRIPLRAWISFSCESWGLSGRGLCDGLITCPEECYQVFVCV
jgi:hypothetical protein